MSKNKNSHHGRLALMAIVVVAGFASILLVLFDHHNIVRLHTTTQKELQQQSGHSQGMKVIMSNTPSPLSSTTTRTFANEVQPRALEFLMSRKQAYEDWGMGVNWKMRGIGFLYARKNILLAAQIDPLTMRSVVIVNVMTTMMPDHKNDTQTKKNSDILGGRDDCDQLSLWVRVLGPEIFAGRPYTVPASGSNDCHWKFDFDPTIAGEYTVDAKVLLWNSKGRDYKAEQQCHNQHHHTGDIPRDFIDQLYPVHSGFKGFKFYYPTESCCEICNRMTPHCKLWTSPPAKMKEPSKFNNGCELYFDAHTPMDEIPASWILGDINLTSPYPDPGPRNRHRVLAELEGTYNIPVSSMGDPQHFLGCGWSYWFTLDFPCHSGELDDRIFMPNNTFSVSTSHLSATGSVSDDDDYSLPLCNSSVERMGHSNGRWIREPFPELDTCPLPYEKDEDFSEEFPTHKHDGAHPHCWNREDITLIGTICVEMNCRFIDQSRYWNSVARMKDWYGVWRERSCDYVEFTDSQLNVCFQKQKIVEFNFEGESVSRNLKVYLMQRLSQLNLYSNATDPDSITVTVTTLSLLHVVRNANHKLRGDFQRLPNATLNHRMYYMNGFFTSSEREPYTHMERMRDLNYLVDEVLIPKGYVPLNAFDPSAAWAYDADGQRDGMHIIGPPLRTIVTKLFHHVCHQVVEGSRL